MVLLGQFNPASLIYYARSFCLSTKTADTTTYNLTQSVGNYRTIALALSSILAGNGNYRRFAFSDLFGVNTVKFPATPTPPTNIRAVLAEMLEQHFANKEQFDLAIIVAGIANPELWKSPAYVQDFSGAFGRVFGMVV